MSVPNLRSEGTLRMCRETLRLAPAVNATSVLDNMTCLIRTGSDSPRTGSGNSRAGFVSPRTRSGSSPGQVRELPDRVRRLPDGSRTPNNSATGSARRPFIADSPHSLPDVLQMWETPTPCPKTIVIDLAAQRERKVYVLHIFGQLMATKWSPMNESHATMS